MTWQTPKTDWDTDDAIGTTDLNRIEGNIADVRIPATRFGNVTIDQNGEYAVTVLTSLITSNTMVLLTITRVGTGAGAGGSAREALSLRDPGVSFTIAYRDESNPTYSVDIAWLLIEPQ